MSHTLFNEYNCRINICSWLLCLNTKSSIGIGTTHPPKRLPFFLEINWKRKKLRGPGFGNFSFRFHNVKNVINREIHFKCFQHNAIHLYANVKFNNFNRKQLMSLLPNERFNTLPSSQSLYYIIALSLSYYVGI